MSALGGGSRLRPLLGTLDLDPNLLQMNRVRGGPTDEEIVELAVEVVVFEADQLIDYAIQICVGDTVESDAMARRIWWIDEFISGENAWTLPGTN